MLRVYHRVWLHSVHIDIVVSYTVGTSASILHMLYSRLFTQYGACVYINAALLFSSDSSESRELPQSACVASLYCFVRIAPASQPTPIRTTAILISIVRSDVHKLFLTATTRVVLSCLRLRQFKSSPVVCCSLAVKI